MKRTCKTCIFGHRGNLMPCSCSIQGGMIQYRCQANNFEMHVYDLKYIKDRKVKKNEI